MTSFAVIKQLKKLFIRTKLGHLGTLDPMASGVLPVAIGYATRLIEFVGDTHKVYQAEMTLGGISDTQDAWGNITYQPHTPFDAQLLPGILERYTGVIEQIPPMYSAVHHQGTRLYELARQGITVERKARQIEIDFLELLSVTRDQEGRPLLKLEVGCSQGTYIRTLCHDIGTDLGTGAYLSALTRIRAGMFRIEEAHSLPEIIQSGEKVRELIKPVDFPLGHLPRINITAESLTSVCNGNRITDLTGETSGLIRLYDPSDRLVAVAHSEPAAAGSYLQPVKVFCS